jgi:uncharacterized membrane protein YphA (DoxX/SURF4 family)
MWNWSLLNGITNVGFAQALTVLWALSVAALLAGFWSRTSAVIAWVLAVSYFNLNTDIHDGGDRVRIVGLFYLMLSPCGAVWSIDRWRHERGNRGTRPVFVPPWPLRLLVLQLMVIYVCGGVEKLRHEAWRDGTTLEYVLGDLYWSLSSYSSSLLPPGIARLSAIVVAAWEVGFPLLILFPLTRPLTLMMGVFFHLSILVTMRIGLFPLYMLCFYIPLIPWERLSRSSDWAASERPRVEPASGKNGLEKQHVA